MATETEEMCDNDGSTPIKVVHGQQPPRLTVVAADDKSESSQYTRWTRQETLTLIEGKKVVENRGCRGRKSNSVFRSGQVESKWDLVASYCKTRAVNRGRVQCTRRWGNMVGDFRKIKGWESNVKQECDSYWVMENELRKENRLPVFFDREVYDVLDEKADTKEDYKPALVTVSRDGGENEDGDVDGDGDGDAEMETDVLFDSGRHALTYDGLFSGSDKMEGLEDGTQKDDDNVTTKIHDPVPISEKRYQPFHQDYTKGNLKDHRTSSGYKKEWMSQEGSKRRRVSTNECEDKSFNDRLIDVLEKNASMLNARIEAEKINCQLDREQRKDYNDSLVSALNKISDALTKIADKL